MAADFGPGAIVGWLRAYARADGLAGCAFLIRPDIVLTCAHVIGAHLGLPNPVPKAQPTDIITIRFEALQDEVTGHVLACGWFSNTRAPRGGLSDIAVVCLDKPAEEITPLSAIAPRMPPQSQPVLIYGAADGYQSYGQQVQGEMAGSSNQRGWRQIDPKNSARGFTVEGGFSGSPVLDDVGNVVFGMIVAVDQKETGVAFAITAEDLSAALQSAGVTARRPGATDRSAGATMAKVRAVYEPEYAERAAETERRQQEIDILRKGIRGLGQTALDALAKDDMPSFTWLSHQMIEQRLAVDREWKVFALLANQLLSSRNVVRPEIVEDLLYSVKEKLRLDSHDGTTVVLAGSIFRYLSGIDNHEPKFELERAIEVMTQFINTKNSAKEIDEDMGGVLYNRACYRAMLREIIGNQDESLSRRLLETALEDLRIAVGILPFLGKRAAQDDDLASLRVNQEFQAIVGGGIAP